MLLLLQGGKQAGTLYVSNETIGHDEICCGTEKRWLSQELPMLVMQCTTAFTFGQLERSKRDCRSWYRS